MLLYGVLIPGAAAGLLALALLRGASATRSAPYRMASGVVAIGGGFASAFVAYFGVTDLLHPQSWQWVFWASLAALPVWLMRGRLSSPAFLACFTAAVAALLLQPMIGKLVPRELQTPQVLGWSIGLGVLFGVLVALLEISAQNFSSKVLAPAWTIYAAGFAALMFQLASARLGQMGGFLAAGCGAMAVLAWLKPQRSLLPGAAVVLVLVLGQVGANAYFFGSNVAGLPLLLAALPPVILAGATRWQWLRNGKPLPSMLVLMILVVIPLGIAFFTTTMGAATNGAGAPEFPY